MPDKRIALVGNPNSGKSSLFNQLTGLRQHVANHPGVTVESYQGSFSHEKQSVQVVDLPGSYSLYASSEDEQALLSTLLGDEDLDLVFVVADVQHLWRSLQLISQLADLGFPLALGLTMLDEAFATGLRPDIKALGHSLQIPVLGLNPRKGLGIEALKQLLSQPLVEVAPFSQEKLLSKAPLPSAPLLEEVRKNLRLKTHFHAHLYLQNQEQLSLPTTEKEWLQKVSAESAYDVLGARYEESKARSAYLEETFQDLAKEKERPAKQYKRMDALDRILTHGVYGTALFMLLLLFIFQVIYEFSAPFMDLIDDGFSFAQEKISAGLPPGILNDFLVNGLLAGVAGVVVFVPQIAMLFFLLALLEGSGYMARAVALFDGLMSRFGLSGRSLIPLVSGMACAVPAIMSTRGIAQPHKRLLTLFVTPLMSCSARLPVYTLLIALMVPSGSHWGAFNLHGLLLLAMYVLGVLAALGTAWVCRFVMPGKKEGVFVMELPPYRLPMLRSIGLEAYQKARIFVLNAGRIILALSVVLWFLSSYGGTTAYQQELMTLSQQKKASLEVADSAALRMKHSWMGQMGRAIEPVIAPLGYDWKIGIALIASLAAREVFVSTLVIVYSLEGKHDKGLKARLQAERRVGSGTPTFTIATCASLMIFYAFAMQCMSTLAITYRETKQMRWPLFQFLYMTALAYVSAWVIYTALS